MIILLEFNELCPNLLAKFMDDGLLPNFRRLYQSSTAYVTDAKLEPPNLEPWIQWVTVHSGMEFEEHNVFHLGEGRKLTEKCLAEVLSDAGVRVGVLGSMNLNYTSLNGYYIPDPWDKVGVARPDWLAPFYDVRFRGRFKIRPNRADYRNASYYDSDPSCAVTASLGERSPKA